MVFPDEKKFNPHPPDGVAYYWHDLRKKTQRISVQQNGRQSLMFRGAISIYGVGTLVLTNVRKNAEMYRNTLEKNLLLFAAEMFS